MATLLQCIEQFIENITVTDKQEDKISSSVSNLDSNLKNKDNILHVIKTFTNGSYERDTNIRPLDDVDVFAVLDKDKWLENGMLPEPQAVLTKIKNYLNSLDDYKDKVKQNRPCVTVELSNIDFDVLPAFEQFGGGYQIPNQDLSGWTYSYPEDLEKRLNEVNKLRSFRVKSIVKAVKYWNRDHNKIIPSYHIEEIAINVLRLYSFSNYEEGIRIWYNNGDLYLDSSKFKNYTDYEDSKKRIIKVKEKLEKAKKLKDEGKEAEAIQIWKDTFGKDFPLTIISEAKSFSEALQKGTLKSTVTSGLSTIVGSAIKPNAGYYGEED